MVRNDTWVKFLLNKDVKVSENRNWQVYPGEEI